LRLVRSCGGLRLCLEGLRRGFTGDRDKRIVEAGPFDRQREYAGIAFDQCAQQRLDPAVRQWEMPEAAIASRLVGKGAAPRPIVMARFEPDLRANAVARRVRRA